jgi:predicted nucleic acid-binding protein
MAMTTVCIDTNVVVALACQEPGISAIVSFDGDFDHVAWLRRISDANQVQDLLTS